MVARRLVRRPCRFVGPLPVACFSGVARIPRFPGIPGIVPDIPILYGASVRFSEIPIISGVSLFRRMAILRRRRLVSPIVSLGHAPRTTRLSHGYRSFSPLCFSIVYLGSPAVLFEPVSVVVHGWLEWHLFWIVFHRWRWAAHVIAPCVRVVRPPMLHGSRGRYVRIGFRLAARARRLWYPRVPGLLGRTRRPLMVSLRCPIALHLWCVMSCLRACSCAAAVSWVVRSSYFWCLWPAKWRVLGRRG